MQKKKKEALKQVKEKAEDPKPKDEEKPAPRVNPLEFLNWLVSEKEEEKKEI